MFGFSHKFITPTCWDWSGFGCMEVHLSCWKWLRGLAVLVLYKCPFMRPGGETSALILLCWGVRTVRENAANENTPASITDLPPSLPPQKTEPLYFCSSWRRGGGTAEGKSLLVFFLSVSDYVNQVLVIQVSSHIWGEGGEHLLHLSSKQKDGFYQQTRISAFKGLRIGTPRSKLVGDCVYLFTGKPICLCCQHLCHTEHKQNS